MLHQFHKKMTLLYTLTTGIILSSVLLIILTYSEKLIKLRYEETFQTGLWTIVSTLQSDHILSHSWLAQMETENHFLIHIEENGTPLLYKGSWNPDTKREVLIQKAKKHAALRHINTSDALLSSNIQQSEIFQIKGDKQEPYQGIVMKLPSEKGYVNLIFLHSLQPLHHAIVRQRCLFALLDILGIFALFLVSWKFVRKSLQPIRENQKKQEAFFAAASHELRSPIAVIQTSANVITTTPAKASHLASNILSECHRLSRLTEDMLTLASSSTSVWSSFQTSLDVDTLLLDTFETFEPICQKQGVRLSLDLPEAPLPSVLGDRERLQQILSILLDNALCHAVCTEEYKQESSKIFSGKNENLPSPKEPDNIVTIQASLTHHHVKIRIIDHGIGIPDEQKSLIFDHFYRGDASRHNKSHFGLGLGIAAELARLHHAELTVTDTKGGGATFQLALPR